MADTEAELLKAIKTRATAEATFLASLTGGIHYEQAPPGTAYPFCVVQITGSDAFYDFDSEYRDMTVTFTMISEERSSAEIWAIYDNLQACMQDADLAVSGHNLMKFRQASIDSDRVEHYWRISVDFHCLVQET